MIPNVLSVAGSDPSGGAGVQADLKTIAALGGYGMAAITALTAQNTRGVTGARAVEPDFVRAQIETVFQDVRVDAVKIGMVATADIARAVAAALRRAGARRIVLDPVMVATSGDRLLDQDAVSALVGELLPLADVATPNLPEAAALTGLPEPTDRAGMERLARAVLALAGGGSKAVLLKGGHLPAQDSPDLLLDATGALWLEGARHGGQDGGQNGGQNGDRDGGRPIHGGGCTLSSALATALAHSTDLRAAARRAKAYVEDAIAAADALEVGGGARPLHHFHGRSGM